MSAEKPCIGCHNCTSACCRRGTGMPLTDAEAKLLRTSGTILLPTIPSPDGSRTLYFLGSDCGNVATGKDGKSSCKIYEHAERPSICKDFEVDSPNCHAIRTQAESIPG